MNKYRVRMVIRGSIVKPSYDGYCDVYAPDEEEAKVRAIREVRRKAHWDSPVADFRVVSVEEC